MNRKGLAGPIVLILIGSFFLLRKWVDIPPIWEMVADWWPLILIVLGVLQLLQRAAGQNRS